MDLFPSRLYAILDVDVVAHRGWAPLDVSIAWLAAGVRLIQLRSKSLASGPLQALADGLVEQCRSVGATLIVNDRADIASLAGADGVHVGQDDLAPGDARAVLGPSAIVGLSTHTVEQIAAAVSEPLSYVAVGPVFGTKTKNTGYEPVGLDLVARAVGQSTMPVVAIGGITMSNAASVLTAGASAVAVISDLLPDSLSAVESRAREWLRVVGG